MISKSSRVCNDPINIFDYCFGGEPNILNKCNPRAVPISKLPPSFFSGSSNNPQFILTQAGKFSFLANPINSSSRRKTIFISPPSSIIIQNGKRISTNRLISNRLF